MGTPVLNYYRNHPERWIRRIYAQDIHGAVVDSGEHTAVCRCVAGAINYFYPDPILNYEMRDKLRAVLSWRSRTTIIVDWNDKADFEEVVRVLELAQI